VKPRPFMGVPDEWYDLVERGMTTPDIAKEVGLSVSTVRSRLMRNDPALHQRVIANGNAKQAAFVAAPKDTESQELMERYERMLKQGITMTSIASMEGVHPGTVRHRIKTRRPDLYAIAKVNARATLGAGSLKAKRLKESQQEVLEKVTRAMRWLQREGVCFPMRVRERGAKDYFFKGNRISASEILKEAKSRGWLDESAQA
jgi:DNA-binding CsgD family transcriptional regulator